MLDLEKLAYRLLARSLDGIRLTKSQYNDRPIDIKPDIDADDFEHIPLVTFTVTGGDAADESVSPPRAWNGTLSITAFGDGDDATRELAGILYDAVWSWNDPFSGAGIIAGLGHVSEISDRSIFTRTSEAELGERVLTQMDGGFDLIFHAE